MSITNCIPIFNASLLLIIFVIVSGCWLDNVTAKNLDINHHHQHATHSKHHHHRMQRSDGNSGTCQDVREYFKSIDIKMNENSDEKGYICNGKCCTNSTEAELKLKATSNFERLLHDHTKSLRGTLESTASLFQGHILELAAQSENKTFYVFSQVYRRMVPLSTKLIRDLYSEIISQLKYTHTYDSNFISANSLTTLEEAIDHFFRNLFPLAYHQAVHLKKNNDGDLHEDYVSCLKHSYDDIQPFGNIPKDLKHSLLKSVQPATIFINALLQSATIWGETDGLYAKYMTDKCQMHLLKMSHCPGCHGLMKTQIKTCQYYCMNVLRGCSAVYSGVLESPWSNVVDAIDNLVSTHIRSDSGIFNTIKQLDTKLSEAIMVAMENGPELEMKVKKRCGTPKLLPTKHVENEAPRTPSHSKWATTPEADILSFLVTIDKSKELYSNIVNNVCEDEDMQRNNKHCWTGDRIGEYSHMNISTGIDTQRYNPEIPFDPSSHSTPKLNELVDKLRKIHKSIGAAIPSATRSYSDIQSDMARHDQEEEGSGRITDLSDDDEYGDMSGNGSGTEENTTPDFYDPTTGKDGKESRGGNSSASKMMTISLWYTIASLLVTISYAKSRFSTTILGQL